MGLLGEVQAAQAAKRKGSKRCGIWEIKQRLSKGDAADLDAAMARPLDEVMHSTIAEVLRARELDISDQIVSHHRRGKCGCPR